MNYSQFVNAVKKMGIGFPIPNLGGRRRGGRLCFFTADIQNNTLYIRNNFGENQPFPISKEFYDVVRDRFCSAKEEDRFRVSYYTNPEWTLAKGSPNEIYAGYLPALFRELYSRIGVCICNGDRCAIWGNVNYRALPFDELLSHFGTYSDLGSLPDDFVCCVKKSVDLSKYDFEIWFESALKTVNLQNLSNIVCGKGKDGGRKFEKWKRNEKSRLRDEIKDFLTELNPETIKRSEIYDRIAEIAKDFNLHVGVVQKVVSILIKYIVFAYYAFPNIKLGEEFLWVKDKKFLDELPVPIDSHVLYSLKKLKADLKITTTVSAKIDGTAWSKMGEDTYKKIQDEIAKLAKQRGGTPLKFEMQELWK